jgi:hypothetical protein
LYKAQQIPKNKNYIKGFGLPLRLLIFRETYFYMSEEDKINIQRQAVIVIHGMGEQRPMDTLRNFVELVAPAIEGSKKRKFYNKPDVLSDTLELRRFTSNEQGESFKTDYFEYYWAYKMSGTQLSDIGWWIYELLWRRITKIPKRLLWIYLFFWLCIIMASGVGIILLLSSFLETPVNTSLVKIRDCLTKGPAKYVISFLWFVAAPFLIYYLGDVVRYMTPRAGNIGQRQDIRKTGIELLIKLHEAKDLIVTKKKKDNKTDEDDNAQEPEEPIFKNRYDRIVIVGHSLGSVIAYDLIKFLWEKYHTKIKLSGSQIREIETAAANLTNYKESAQKETHREAFREKQFELWQSQYKELGSWRISDFVTLGSPMAHSKLLLAKSRQHLKQKQDERELPTCPPTPEEGKTFHYTLPDTDIDVLHHAAPFALTRWTNITFKQDYVGGNINDFGEGIENHFKWSEVWKRNFWPFLSHVYYWDNRDKKMLALVREKLHLRISTNGNNKTKSKNMDS